MLCLASYYLNGSNFIDLALLKRTKHLKGDRVSFNRSKTGCLITVKITPKIQGIIDYFENDSEYIFGLRNQEIHITGQSQKDRVDKLRKQTNDDIKTMAKLIGKDPTEFTFHNFRDTFAFKLHQAGVDFRLIQQALGHKRIQQTLTYLSKFGKEEIDNLASFL